MTAKTTSSDFDEKIRLMELAKSCIESNNYQQASLLLQRIKETPYFSPQIALLKSECAYELRDYMNALRLVNEALEKEADQDIVFDSAWMKARLYFLRSRIFDALNLQTDREGDLEEVKRIVHSDGKTDSVDKKTLEVLEKKLEKRIGKAGRERSVNAKKRGELEKEAETVLYLMELSEEKGLLTTHLGMVHIISMSWFDKWKRYTNFDVINSAKKKGASKKENGIIENEDGEAIYPGPINQDDILEFDENLLIDLEPAEEQCNWVLKRGLVENRDFMIVSHLVWKYLYGIYSGRDIKRFVFSKDGSRGNATIEVWLKKTNVLVCPPPFKDNDYTRCKLQTVYMSKRDSVRSLAEKLTRIHETFYTGLQDGVSPWNCQLWKLAPGQNYQEVIELIQANKEASIQRTKLNNGTILDEAELAEDDVIICEYKSETKPETSSQAKNGKVENQKDKKTTEDLVSKFKISKSTYTTGSRYGICGLQNLGNTCFMNSALQCLSNLEELTNYFLDNKFITDLNPTNPLGTGGKCAASYAELMKQLWHGTSSCVSPWEVKRMLINLAAQFEGFNQQDSMEFLSYLLDGLHEDLNRVLKKETFETIEEEGEDKVLAARDWANHMKRNQSVIVDLMHGQYKSTVTCPDCKRSPVTFDPFLSLSLPIPTLEILQVPVFFTHKNTEQLPLKVTLNMSPNDYATTILTEISKLFEIPEGELMLKRVQESRMVKTDWKGLTVKEVKDMKGVIFVQQVYNVELDGPFEDYLRQEKTDIEVQIYHSTNKKDADPASFARFLKLSVETSLSDLRLQVYAVMRNYLQNYFALEEESRFFFKIDPTKSDLATLKEEYEAMEKVAKEKGHPYEIEYRTKPKQKTANPLPEDATSMISSLISGPEQLTLEVVINRKLNLDYMKLNKCKPSELTNQVQNQANEINLYDCFDCFTKPEILDQNNLWYCRECKDHKQAKKKMDVYKANKVLIICLKRFKTSRINSIGSFYFSGGSAKITTPVDFPVEGLDLSKYLIGEPEHPPIYDLFGVVNHYGGMGGGHYTAYAKNPAKNQWYDYNDSSVSKQSSNEIVSKAAYLLFYKRRDVSVESLS